jgi:hypothetical protein
MASSKDKSDQFSIQVTIACHDVIARKRRQQNNADAM